uniref:Saposin B-type domain-containing protein n=1 Tax=Oncorhynchus mykiss TaxID=8022 RepID=A0A8C7NW85_ONCMY
MKTSLVLLALSLLACSVWEIHGQCQEVDLDDQEVLEAKPEKRMEQQLKGTCWACKWALKKVKKSISSSSSPEEIKQKLLSFCGKLPLGKSTCEDLVKKHLWVVIDELNTSDGVRTICVKIKACKPKEVLDLSY